MKKKGFVLAETIIVITVLCVILVVLYGAYSKVLIDVNKKALYDNTEYLYKTNIIRKYLEKTLLPNDYENTFTIICSNSTTDKCYDETPGDYRKELFKTLKVEAVYITSWNTKEISDVDLATFEATTQSYIKSLDYEKEDSAFRIVVMFKDENNNELLDDGTEKKVYQYASIRFGSRG